MNKSQRFRQLQRSIYETLVLEFTFSAEMDLSKISLVFDGDDVNSDLSDFSSDDDQFYVEGTTLKGARGYSESDSDSSFEGFMEENLAEAESNMQMKACLATEPEIDFGYIIFKGNRTSEQFYAELKLPYSIFKDFLDDSMIGEIAQQTNLYSMRLVDWKLRLRRKLSRL